MTTPQRTLILVDLQNDFCKDGALEVQDGNAVIPIANQLMEQFDLVIATQDWHPANHESFAAMHPWRKPGQVIDLHGLQQVLWPIHCVQDMFGSEFVKELNT
ncbi:MAG: isochorismatase family protein, partial [Saprospiraceae bacterium]